MTSKFESPKRLCASEITTAAVLVLILSMGISTLYTPEAPQSAGIASAKVSPVAQSHASAFVKKS